VTPSEDELKTESPLLALCRAPSKPLNGDRQPIY
jgi:hypothetical protein